MEMTGRFALSDEQLLALTYEDLCESEYLSRVHAARSEADEEDKMTARWVHTPFMVEDMLNFGQAPAVARELCGRRRVQELAHSSLTPDPGIEAIYKQTYIFACIARTVRKSWELRPVEAPHQLVPLPSSTLCLSELALIAALTLAENDVSFTAHGAGRFSTSLTSIIEIFGVGSLPSVFLAKTVNLLTRYACY
jgi:hypothetical protein